jgi:hypothetical protein
MKRGQVNVYADQAHAAGAAATRAFRGALYGSRYTPDTNAGTALSRGNIGIGKKSVWQGPLQVRSGAPVLKRDKPSGG